MGVMAQCALLGVDDQRALELYTAAGLPSHALEDLDFPLSLDQELIICMGLVRTLAPTRSPTVALFRALQQSGIESLGVLGMAMRHAATAIDALKVCLAYPQLTWGHSRMVVRNASKLSIYSFAMERPTLPDATSGEINRLVEYCLVLDLVTSMRNIADIVESDEAPAYINFPFEQPPDWAELAGEVPCAVNFSEQEACFAFPAALDDKPLPRANALMFRSYESIVKKQSQMLGEDFSTTERVSRWLWAYTPPPRRAEVAKLLAMSECNHSVVPGPLQRYGVSGRNDWLVRDSQGVGVFGCGYLGMDGWLDRGTFTQTLRCRLGYLCSGAIFETSSGNSRCYS